MMSKGVVFGSVAKDYALYRDELPDLVFEQLERYGLQIKGRPIVELGCGTGIVSRQLASRGAKVVGVDPSPELLAEARSIAGAQSQEIQYFQGRAEQTGLPSGSFDAAFAIRAWHWFDRERATREVKRILKKAAHLAVIDSAFIPNRSQLARETLELIKKHMGGGDLLPAGTKRETRERVDGLPANWFKEWEDAGFTVQSWQVFYELTFTHEGWRGRVRSLSWISEMETGARESLDAELAEHMSIHYGDGLIRIPHVCSVALLKR